jgi:preprotein translocase subunit SecY
MNKLISTLRNIWSIEELRKRILFTLLLLLVYRFGSFVLLPGVVPAALEAAAKGRGANDLLGLINSFTGGAFNKGSIFALGVMPYITASIIIQLLGFAVPYFQRLQQHEGESGRKKLNQLTRVLAVGVTLVQGSGYLQFLRSQNAVAANMPQALFWFIGLVILAAGTIFAMWLGERITERGIGNGTSFIIMSGIIDELPKAIGVEFTSRNWLFFVGEMAAWFAIIMATIVIIQGVRKIPLQFAKRMVGRGTDNMPMAGNRDYLPVKLNAAGVMPIIFAQALMFLPATLAQFGQKPGDAPSAFYKAFSDITHPAYNIVFFLLVVIFTYVYTALIVNPTQYAEYLKRQNAFIPGVKPGQNTAEYIDSVTTRITLPGALAIGLLAVLPGLMHLFGINNSFTRFFGGTSILIMIGVILDTLQQIESYLLLNKYDALVKEGKMQGRGGFMEIGANM